MLLQLLLAEPCHHDKQQFITIFVNARGVRSAVV